MLSAQPPATEMVKRSASAGAAAGPPRVQADAGEADKRARHEPLALRPRDAQPVPHGQRVLSARVQPRVGPEHTDELLQAFIDGCAAVARCTRRWVMG